MNTADGELLRPKMMARLLDPASRWAWGGWPDGDDMSEANLDTYDDAPAYGDSEDALRVGASLALDGMACEELP